MLSWLQDLRVAVRSLGAARLFTVVATLTLAIGVGANTAVFSLLDDAVLQPLPVRNPHELRTIVVVTRSGTEMSNVPAELFAELRQSRIFAGLLACWRTEMHVSTGGDPERVLVQYVSGDYYRTLGVAMLHGRPIAPPDEDSPERVAVISHRFWMQRFGGDPGAVGRQIGINGLPATIVAITPPRFFGIDRGVAPDVSVPLPAKSPFSNLWVLVRLQPGAAENAAESEAQAALQRALEIIRPRLSRYRAAEREAILTMRTALRPGAQGVGASMHAYLDPLRILFYLSAALLLIACVNVAHLLLARGLAREHEYGLRPALGAGRARLLRQALVESAVLAIAGSLAGAALAALLRQALVALLMADLSYTALTFHLDARLLAFTAANAAIVVVLFGLAPALRSTRVDPGTALRRTGSRAAQRQPLARGLIVAQVALSLALLIGAGLLVRSFRALGSRDTGVSLDGMLTMRIAMGPRETQRTQDTRVYSEIVRRVRDVPGVAAAALGWDFALGSGSSGKSLWVEGQPADVRQSAGFNVVGPGFFATAGVPLLLGREFTDADDRTARKVVIVNETWVRRYANGRHPIGLHVGDEGAGSVDKYEVVGVVRDSLTMRMRREPDPMLYQPLLQDEWGSSVVLHVRARGNPRLLAGPVRDAIRATDPNVPVYGVTTLDERRALALTQDRMMALLASALGAIALLLTVVGMYGVMAYRTARRTAEIGTRLALGATAAAIKWMILREALALVTAGAAIGIPVALTLVPLLRTRLFGVGPQDPLTIGVSLAVLAAAGALAAFLPARRASRLAPIDALRQE
jgi:putative ABC transport system permease protein